MIVNGPRRLSATRSALPCFAGPPNQAFENDRFIQAGIVFLFLGGGLNFVSGRVMEEAAFPG